MYRQKRSLPIPPSPRHRQRRIAHWSGWTGCTCWASARARRRRPWNWAGRSPGPAPESGATEPMLQRTTDTVTPAPAARIRLEGDRTHLGCLAIAGLAVLLAVACLAGLSVGAASGTPALGVLAAWAGLTDGEGISAADMLIMGSIRLPRIVMGVLIGAALAMSGAVLQGLFRNPLADPTIVGVSAGASLGAVSVIMLGNTLLAGLSGLAGAFALPLAAFFGALTVTMLLYRIATRQGRTSIATMLLAGIALSAFAFALTGILTYMADDAQLRDLTFWNLGSLAGSTWTKIWSAGPVILAALLATPFLARSLNALALGESAAGHMGISVQRMKNAAIVMVAAATGAAVAVAGTIGFVGIVVPHLLRLAIGPDHRYLLPAAGLLGATFLVMADAVSRTIVAPAELPIGIVTATVGAPFFLWILLRRRGLLDL
ncbi:MAG: iron ABC transporter [Phyllobacteriaceae bacterium]|nr:iron ABC transporter [Phyllobacteriaceae bacterium]